VPVVEDKIVQRATVAVLNAIYETDFLGFSYGFRPGRSQHNALDALNVGLMKRQVNWVLDADIRGFFEAISHQWLVKFVEHRIGDRRVVRLIQKWLKAGALENGTWTQQEEGTQQGGSASPLLANIYLHYVFDLWVQRWRQRSATARSSSFASPMTSSWDSSTKSDAEGFLAEMRERLRKFGLELHPQKTRLLEFGRWAAVNRRRRGLGKPETFNFLGFTHICGKTKKGWFTVARQTERRRVQTKLTEIKAELRRRLHAPVPDVGQWLRSVVTGHFRYYGVPGNYKALAGFRDQISQLWHRALGRRSQKGHVTWERMARLTTRWLPPAHIYHPQPLARLGVTT
jgi:RNA-directed DNA polymerase